MTKEAAHKFIGKRGKYRTGSLMVDVEVIDHKFVFGRDDVKIRPVSGSGEQWVQADSVELAK